MADVIIYTRQGCSYCIAAKALLDKKQVTYEEITLEENPQIREDMIARTGGNTFPQIIIHGEPVGGFKQLYALEQSGELDKRLAH